MQLTGPLFLFLFLPLSLLLTLPLPRPARQPAMAAVSLCWYVLANYRNPAGLGVLLALVLFGCLVARLRPRRAITALGTLPPLALLVGARLLTEYRDLSYPAGLTFVALGVISLTLDRARGDAPPPRRIFEPADYLLFFPVLTVGPLVRYRTWQAMNAHAGRTPALFSLGARRYMLGFVKRIAAALLFRAFSRIVSLGEQLSLLVLLLLIPIACVLLYLLLTGSADLARGVAALYGFRLPADRAPLRTGFSPHRLFFGTLHAFFAYLDTYVAAPLRRRLPGRAGRALGALLCGVLLVLLLRTRPEMLLFALPVLLSALVAALLPPAHGKRRYASALVGENPTKAAPVPPLIGKNDGISVAEKSPKSPPVPPRNKKPGKEVSAAEKPPKSAPLPPFRKKSRWYLLLPATIASALLTAPFALAFALDRPLDALTLFDNRASGAELARLAYFQNLVSDFRYLFYGLVFLLALPLLAGLLHLLGRARSRRVRLIPPVVEILLLFALFSFSIFYFLPQFPQYADSVFPTLHF